MNKESPAWRKFEELVARIEKVLAPQGAVVKSPDRIRDLVTDHYREVDASIRMPDGDGTLLITVECRDRKGRQDDLWIEQLVTKREKIGARRTIAVSSSGFSNSAIVTARHYGIELRRMDEITDVEIAQRWASGLKLTVLTLDFTIMGFSLFGVDSKAIRPDQLAEHLRQLSDSDLALFPFLKNIADSEIFSVVEIAKRLQPPKGLIENGAPVHFQFNLDFDRNVWRFDAADGESVISRLTLEIEFTLKAYPAPVQSVKQYSSPERTLYNIVEGVTESNEIGAFNIKAFGVFGGPLPEHLAWENRVAPYVRREAEKEVRDEDGEKWAP
jgi:hypothetical protein